MADDDSTLLAIASKGPVDGYAELGRRLRALDAELDERDGLVWFNRWYAALSAALVESSRRNRFDDARFIERLECLAAERYFDALSAHLTDPGSGPSCWEPLFQARGRVDVLPLQHAIAGINAHINHDLPVALVLTCAELEAAPARGAPVHADYQRLCATLEAVLGDARAWLGGGAAEAPESERELASRRAPLEALMARPRAAAAARPGTDVASGREQLDDVLSIWSTKRACEAAWAAAEVRWVLRVTPLISHHHLEALDRMVGLAGRGLLHCWQRSSHVERRSSSPPSR